MAKEKAAKNPTNISELIPDDKNFNTHNTFGMGLMDKSLRKFGLHRSIVLDKNNKIIAGNATVETAGAIGIEDVQVIESDGKRIIAVKRTDIDLDTPEGREMALADNAAAKANIILNAELIVAELTEAVAVSWGVEVPENETVEDDFDAEPPKVPITVLGDVYELNQHRLICGDSTDGNVWQKISADETMATFTSPPYNVANNAALVGNTHASKRGSLYQDGDTDDVKDYIGLLNLSLAEALKHTGGVVFNVQPLANNKIDLLKWIASFETNFNEIIVWNKSQAAPAMAKGVCSAAYEWLVVFSQKATRAIPLSSWRGSLSNVYNAPPQRNNEFAKQHAATFPMHLPTYAMADLMNRCSGLVDCFMGTGTSLIAAEQLGRKCYGIELSPAYCDLIVARWLKFKQAQSPASAITIKRNGKELSEKEMAKYLHQTDPK